MSRWKRFERVSPKTYALPGDLALFTREFDGAATAAAAMGGARRTTSGTAKREERGDDNDENGDKSNNVWIMKPIGQSQGRGIFFVWKRAQIRRWQNRRKKLDEELNANKNVSGFSHISHWFVFPSISNRANTLLLLLLIRTNTFSNNYNNHKTTTRPSTYAKKTTSRKSTFITHS